jgi:hypothetical protein
VLGGPRSVSRRQNTPIMNTILEQAMKLMEDHPSWSPAELKNALAEEFRLSAGKAHTIANRAEYILILKRRGWLSRRRKKKVPPGETDPGFDNAVRVLEDHP